MVGPRVDGDDGAVGQDDDGVGVDVRDAAQQVGLLGRQVEVGAVEAFGFGFFGQAEEDDGDVVAAGGFDGFGFERGVGGREVEGVAGGEVGVDAACGEGVEEGGSLW